MSNLIIFVCLIIFPLTVVWWLFFPLIFIAIFLWNKVQISLFAALILDIVYFGGYFSGIPFMLAGTIVIIAVHTLLKDKLRFNAY